MLAINPGATTTEIGYFSGDQVIWRQQINHPPKRLSAQVSNQFQFRYNSIESYINKIDKLDAIAARGGPLKPLAGGTYKINEKMLSDYKLCKYSNHASNIAALIADKISHKFDVPSYIVDPVSTDEFIDIARISGVLGIKRKSRGHALNIKHCAEKVADDLNITLEESKFIVAHLGSGFSIAAVENGKIIDVNDALLGMGPFSIERAGALPISGILDEVFSSGKSRQDIEQLFSTGSGLMGYLDTNNFPEIEQRIENGDEYATLIVDAMVYQIVKEIGGLQATFAGNISALILTGGLSNSNILITKLKNYLDFIRHIFIYPDSLELEALNCGVLRVLNGKEEAKNYL